MQIRDLLFTGDGEIFALGAVYEAAKPFGFVWPKTKVQMFEGNTICSCVGRKH